ncbi:MAG: hypothetical protein U1E21_13555 [Reyranellaceae bacterium]
MVCTDLIIERAALLADAVERRLTAEGRARLGELASRAERAGYRQLARPMREVLDA